MRARVIFNIPIDFVIRCKYNNAAEGFSSGDTGLNLKRCQAKSGNSKKHVVRNSNKV